MGNDSNLDFNMCILIYAEMRLIGLAFKVIDIDWHGHTTPN